MRDESERISLLTFCSTFVNLLLDSLVITLHLGQTLTHPIKDFFCYFHLQFIIIRYK